MVRPIGGHNSKEHTQRIVEANRGNKYSFIRGYSKDAYGYIVFNEGYDKIKEHRLVMEKYLGRPLLPSEHIHHKDGNITNNNIDNLEIISNSKHIKLHRKLQAFNSRKGKE